MTIPPVPPVLDLPLSGVQRDLPRIGGRLKEQPADFEVEEIPAYEPCGDGEHLFLWIEKRDLSSEQLVWRIGGALGVPTRDIGVAGIKDRRSISRQYVSVPARYENRVSEIVDDQFRILNATRHRHKLRRGHLKGNRFSILIRQPRPGTLDAARKIARALQQRGFPNYFGNQRFGADGETLATGLALLWGTKTPRDVPRSSRRFLLSLSLSAAQSFLFNMALSDRIRDQLLYQVLEGDVMQVVASGGKFVAEDAPREQQRMEKGEVVTTGPMFGPKMVQASGQVADREAKLLEAQQLTAEHFRRYPKLTLGTRRPYLVRPWEWTIHDDLEGLRFRFCLPSGTYATTLLREFM